MEWAMKATLNGKDFEFLPVEDEPLMFIMQLNKNHVIQRDISSTRDEETWILRHDYIGIENGVEVPKAFSNQVYQGKTITYPLFFYFLLEHVMYSIYGN